MGGWLALIHYKQHQGFPCYETWGHINKTWKVMIQRIYQLPPHTRMELLHLNIYLYDRVKLFNKDFTYIKGLNLYVSPKPPPLIAS